MMSVPFARPNEAACMGEIRDGVSGFGNVGREVVVDAVAVVEVGVGVVDGRT